MPDAVLDEAIEQIADGLPVDWGRIDAGAPSKDQGWAKCLHVLNDIVSLHRAAAVDFEQTTMAGTGTAVAETASETWGRYQLANKVGEGSYGAVYRARDTDLELDVAIKILHRRVGDTRLRELLLQEGRALARVRHDNVVRVLGIEAHGDRAGLCMEFVPGRTLADVIRTQGKLNAREAVLIGEDLCRALLAVHRAGFIHRDIKAKNVMRDDTGRIVLMDFGTGRMTDKPEGRGDRAGTPLYMAPEVLAGADASVQSDVYSLGVLLYHLVTGEYPVDARSVEELRELHAQRRHRWLSERRPDLPVAFMQVVERAIALDPDERYANASELLAGLSALKLGANTGTRRLAKPAIAVAVVIAGMLLLGAITSTHFNIALQRSEFTNETGWDWLRWGRLSSFTPLLSLIVVLLAGTVVAVVRRLVLAASVSARRLDANVRQRTSAIAHRYRLDEAPVLASFTLLLSSSAVAAVWWYFTPLLFALFQYPSTADASDLQLLSPYFVWYHNRYRQILSALVIFLVAVWYPVMQLVRRGQSLHKGLWAGGIGVICVGIAMLHFPYRMLYFNKSFEAVRWNDSYCYLIGERSADALLFCPDVGVPRLRTVSKGSAAITKLGITESLFRHFDSNVGGSTKPAAVPK